MVVCAEHKVNCDRGGETVQSMLIKDTTRAQREEIVRRIAEEVSPDSLTIHDHMSIIATVGRGMVHNCGTAARLFGAMSNAGINVRMIDQGSSELSIIVGVDDKDYEETIKAIYGAFVNQ